jgi:oxygen-independent coproporphyrinogen-3 oxidase
MAGLYIHIPFCRQACHYCGFHFSTSQRSRTAMIDALACEIALQKHFFQEPGHNSLKTSLQSVYLGGGTPSLLEPAEIAVLLGAVHDHFDCDPDCEITLEANPDDMTISRIEQWQQAGINRLSLGVQSFFDEDLRWMNRAHNAADAQHSLRMIRDSGMGDFSADLIFGVPTLTDAHWEENITRMIALEVPHLSCYGLTVEPRTPLETFIRSGKYAPLDEAQSARQFARLMERLDAAGYVQYEISNFSVPGHRARHNSSYWKGDPYLGIGPSAHSFRKDRRQWNVSSNAAYQRAIMRGEIPCEAETLTAQMSLNEYVMTSLRTVEGCALSLITARWGATEADRIGREAEVWIGRGQLIREADTLRLTRSGKLFADGIAAALFA